MPTIAEAVRDLVIEQAAETGLDPYSRHVYLYDPNLLQAAYERAGRKAHALDEMEAVMAAVRRSPLFEKAGTITAHSRTGAAREVRYAAYKLKKTTQEAG